MSTILRTTARGVREADMELFAMIDKFTGDEVATVLAADERRAYQRLARYFGQSTSQVQVSYVATVVG